MTQPENAIDGLTQEQTDEVEDTRGAVSLLDEALARIEIADECERARIAGNHIVSPDFHGRNITLGGSSAQLHAEHMRMTALTLAIASASVTAAEFLEQLAYLTDTLVTALEEVTEDVEAEEETPG